jgi:hypothetical protein
MLKSRTSNSVPDQAAPRLNRGAGARLASRRFALTRLLWAAIVLVDLALFTGGVFARHAQLQHPDPHVRAELAQLGLSVDFYVFYNLTFEIIFALGFVLVGVIIFASASRKMGRGIGYQVLGSRTSADTPHPAPVTHSPTPDWMALFVSLMLIVFGTAAHPILPTMNALAVVEPAFQIPVRFFTFLAWTSILTFIYLFPDGRLVPRWTIVSVALTVAIEAPWHLFPDSPLSPWTWPRVWLVALVLVVWGLPLLAQIYRYLRISNEMQRQQTKWVVYGMSIAVPVALAFFIPSILTTTPSTPVELPGSVGFAMLSTGVIHIAALVVPITIGISVLRFRLWAIDVIINRTLVYVPLTGILAGLYAAVVSISQRTFIYLTGDTSDVAIVFSTLVLAALFTPVKNGLQSVVDRRFKQAPNPKARLKELREQVNRVVRVLDAEQVSFQLVDRATRAFGAEGGAIFLNTERSDRMKLVHTTGEWRGEAQISVPLEHKGRRIGVMSLGPREEGAAYTDQDRKMLQEVANAVADAISLVRRLD